MTALRSTSTSSSLFTRNLPRSGKSIPKLELYTKSTALDASSSTFVAIWAGSVTVDATLRAFVAALSSQMVQHEVSY